MSIPIAGPLPDVADHVVEAIAVGLEAADRRGPGVAILVRVVDREDTLPGVGDGLAIRSERARPVVLAVAAAARGESGRWRSEPMTNVPPRMNTMPPVSLSSAGRPE
jgi:hypothetical protein